MGEFEEGLRILERLREQHGAPAGGELERALSRETLVGARFSPGDQVVDRVTGLGGHVVHTGFALHHAAPPGRS